MTFDPWQPPVPPAEAAEIGRWLARWFNRTSDAVFVVGRGARIVWWSPRAEQMLGVSAARAKGRHCYDVFAGLTTLNGGRCRATCPRLEAARRGALPDTMPIQRVAPDGEVKLYTLGFMADDSGQYLIHVVREQEPELDDGQCPNRQAAGSALPAATHHLTPREGVVLRLLSSGTSNQAIADKLNISGLTVRNHVRHLLHKLGVHSRLEAAAVGAQRAC